MTDYTTLRSANAARHKIWMKGEEVGLLWRATELAGEVGEVQSLLSFRSLDEEQFANLSDEIADVIICIDLFLMDLYAFELTWEFDFLADLGSLHEIGNMLGVYSGLACNGAKKLERRKRGFAGSTVPATEVWGHLYHLYQFTLYLAGRFAIDPKQAVQTKFNATSDKVGLPVRLQLS